MFWVKTFKEFILFLQSCEEDETSEIQNVKDMESEAWDAYIKFAARVQNLLKDHMNTETDLEAKEIIVKIFTKNVEQRDSFKDEFMFRGQGNKNAVDEATQLTSDD